jgi:hypothetical protein
MELRHGAPTARCAEGLPQVTVDTNDGGSPTMSEHRDPTAPANGDAQPAAAAGLEAGGHEPAPPSDDPAIEEARGTVQAAFDEVEATHASDHLWDEASRRADEKPAPGTDGPDSGDGGAAGIPPAGEPPGE